MFVNSTFRNCFFPSSKKCLSDKNVCNSLVLVFVIAVLFSMKVLYKANRVLVHNDTTISFTFPTLCKQYYHEFCLIEGECYVVPMKDEEEAAACMCTSFYGGARCEIYMWWT